ncbi:MAG TPA: TonB-dependent receptor [Bryobacteraceae bacterium]
MRKWGIASAFHLCFAAFLCLAFCITALAQSDVGSIAGFVRDPSGAVVPGAKVAIKSEATGQTRNVVTDASGHYSVTNLLPGLYEMTAEATGFKAFTSTHNKLDANTSIELDANLQVGAATQTIEVSATAQRIQTQSGAVQSQISATQVQNQELNGRDPVYMAGLLPGVRGGSTMGDFNGVGPGGNPYQINGARQQDTAVTFDGAPALRTRANGAIIGVPSVAAISEIHVLTADYQAEYGNSSGGQIRFVSKSGTTQFHGSLYEYFRNTDLNANQWSRNKDGLGTSPEHFNNWGFSLGGPVAIPKVFTKFKNNIFFFVNEDWIRRHVTDTQQETVPTPLMRTGDFSELLGPNPFYSGVHQIYYPGTCPKLGAATCQPVPGNIIPVNSLSPNGIAIIDAYPGPTPGYLAGTDNWIAQAPHPYNQRKGVLNFDFIPNESNHISIRRSDLSYDEYQPFDQGSGLTPKYFRRPNQTTTANWTWSLNPTTVNEMEGTFSLDDVYIPVNTAAIGFNRDKLNPPITYPFIFGGKDITEKIPTVSVPNFYGLAGGPYPSHSSGPIYTFSDSLSKVIGNHTLKFGFYFNYQGENDGDQINVATVPGGANNQNGSFTFTDAGTGSTSGVGIANLAMGYADSYTEIGPRALTIWRAPTFEEFAQDSWQITPKFHLNYGIRFTTIVPYKALWGNADYFDGNLYNPANAVTVDPTTGNVILADGGNPYNGVVIPGLSAFPKAAIGRVAAAASNSTSCAGGPCTGLFDPSLPKYYGSIANKLQPRVGIAYQITPKTVIRAGAGRFVTRMGLLDNIFPGGNSPFQPFITVDNPTVDNPGAALTPGILAPNTITTPNPNLQPPEAWNWNATLETETFWNGVLSVAYVGRRGLHGWQVYDINQPTVGATFANPGMSVNALRPYKGFSAIQEEESVVNSSYNALQVSWNRRYLNGLTWGGSYTLSKSMDNGSNYRDIVPDTYDTSNLWAPSEFDTRQIFVINASYDLPWLRDQKTLVGKLLGGWTITTTLQFQTGTPCGVGTNNDYAGVGNPGSFGCGSEGQFWDINGAIPSGPKQFGSGGYFATTMANGQPLFSQPAPGTFVLYNGVRDSIYGPGFQDENLALFKKFAINERNSFEFRAEAYDVLNHPNWSGPQYTPTSGTFGQVTSKTGLSRELQLSLLYQF